MKRWVSAWGPVLAWAGLIFFLSSIPDLSSGLESDFVLRKAAHVVEYAAVLAALLWRAARAAFGWAAPGLFAFSFALSLLYAASDEWHQGFVPGRGTSPIDWTIDAAGALAAGLFLRRSS